MKLRENKLAQVFDFIQIRDSSFTALWGISRELGISEGYAGQLCRCLLARGLLERRRMPGRKGRRVEYRARSLAGLRERERLP